MPDMIDNNTPISINYNTEIEIYKIPRMLQISEIHPVDEYIRLNESELRRITPLCSVVEGETGDGISCGCSTVDIRLFDFRLSQLLSQKGILLLLKSSPP